MLYDKYTTAAPFRHWALRLAQPVTTGRRWTKVESAALKRRKRKAVVHQHGFSHDFETEAAECDAVIPKKWSQFFSFCFNTGSVFISRILWENHHKEPSPRAVTSRASMMSIWHHRESQSFMWCQSHVTSLWHMTLCDCDVMRSRHFDVRCRVMLHCDITWHQDLVWRRTQTMCPVNSQLNLFLPVLSAWLS